MENMQEPERKGCRIPELGLVAEVLSQAIIDLAAGQPEIRKSARKWLEHDGEDDDPFTARWCCLQLGLEPRILKDAVSKTKQLGCLISFRRELYSTRRGFHGWIPKGGRVHNVA